MEKRIKELRKSLGITQQEFADKLGLKRNTIATYEIGKTDPSERTISDICEKFNVNEEWLKNGVGEMFVRISRSAEIAQLTTDLMRDKESFKTKLIMTIAKLDVEEMEMLERIANKLLEAQKESD